MDQEQIRRVLDQAGVQPSKQLGQNFLIDETVADWIVDQLALEATDTIVEVGPGTGALTEHLVGKTRLLILIEFDRRLASELTAKYAEREDVVVYHEDAAQFDRRNLFGHGRTKFLGNLPYSSGGAIMKNLLTAPHPFCRAVVMLQKEVVERMEAKPGTKDYGMLSLRMQIDWQIRTVGVVGPDSFHPRPHVDSAVAVLEQHQPGSMPVLDRRRFDELVKRGFSQRRKQLRKQLLGALPPLTNWAEISANLGVSEKVRGEELGLRQWIELTKLLSSGEPSSAQRDDELFDIVDCEDVVIGQETRARVHADDLMHRAIHVWVTNKRGDLYLQKRSRLKDKSPGLWDSSVSGHLDHGESYEQAARRELTEEMGIHFPAENILNEVLRLEPSQENGWEFFRVYTVTHRGGGVRFPAAEIEAMMPFTYEQIRRWMDQDPDNFTPVFTKIFMSIGKDVLLSDKSKSAST